MDVRVWTSPAPAAGSSAVEAGITGEAGRIIDAGGRLVSPPFIDCHFHMDATLSLGLPRLNQSGTLLEGIALWGELKPLLTVEAVKERALRYCDLAVAQGLLAIRSHVDICDDRLLAVDALLEVRQGDRALYRPAARRLPAGRLHPLAQCGARTSNARSTRASMWSAASRISSAPWRTGRPASRRSAKSPRSAASWSTCIATRATTRCRATSRC